MNTLRLFSHGDVSVPGSTSWYLADLGEFRGQQTLHTRQAPQRLKALREHALIESAVSSNRIEGNWNRPPRRESRHDQTGTERGARATRGVRRPRAGREVDRARRGEGVISPERG